jgi:hypothetical protein
MCLGCRVVVSDGLGLGMECDCLRGTVWWVVEGWNMVVSQTSVTGAEQATDGTMG